VKAVTFFLWLGPVIFVLIGLFGLFYYFQRQRRVMEQGDGPS